MALCTRNFRPTSAASCSTSRSDAISRDVSAPLACTKAEMLVGPCVPKVVAATIPVPASPMSSNGKALFYLADGGRVMRVGI
jgi:hypothetical protein